MEWIEKISTLKFNSRIPRNNSSSSPQKMSQIFNTHISVHIFVFSKFREDFKLWRFLFVLKHLFDPQLFGGESNVDERPRTWK